MPNTTKKPSGKQAQKRTQRYRTLYSKAKKMGLVKGDKDARKLKPSGYMKTKLNKLDPFLQGDYKAIKVPNRKVYREYSKTPTATVPFAANQRVLVRNDPDTIARVKGSVVRIIRKLGWGEFERIPIPYNIRSIADLERLAKDEQRLDVIEALAVTDNLEDFYFTFYGNNSHQRFGGMDDLLAYFLKYDSVIEAMTDDEKANVADNFQLYRAKGHIPAAQGKGRVRTARRRKRRYRDMNEFQREEKLVQQARYWERHPEKYEEHKKKAREANRRRREKETPKERAARLKAQRKYQKQYREEKKGAKE